MMTASLLGMVAAPILTVVFAPGFLHGGDQYQLSVPILRIMIPYLFFIASVAFAGSVLNTRGHFAAPEFAPGMLNVCMISGTFCLRVFYSYSCNFRGSGVRLCSRGCAGTSRSGLGNDIGGFRKRGVIVGETE